MNSAVPFGRCLLLNLGVVAGGAACHSIVKNLHDMKPSGLRLVAFANVQQSARCYKFVKELGIEVLDDYRQLLSLEHLDLIMELTGDKKVMADLMEMKRPSVGVIDRQASMRLIEMARLYAQVERSNPDATLETPLASTLLEASPDGILVIDRKFCILNSNKSALIPGNTDGAITGKHCYEVMYDLKSPCNPAERGCPARETMKTGKVARTIYEVHDVNKPVQIRQATAYPMFNRFGEVAQLVLAIRDMTGPLSERIEERTQAMKKDLARMVQEDRLTSLGRLVASVCHEINNPITSIVTFTKLVQKLLRSLIEQRDLGSDEMFNVERYLNLSFSEAMRCGNIVKNLLTFARPKSVEAKLIDISELVQTILLLTAHQCELANVRCEVKLPPTSFCAWGDYAQIQQCLLNLIFNAIDAMPDGGVITISGGSDIGANLNWLEVSDTGQGIESHDLNRIFEPFYSTKSGKGNGLGLSMVYGIIREHNGSVEVESEPGKGATFRIKLPEVFGAEGSPMVLQTGIPQHGKGSK